MTELYLIRHGEAQSAIAGQMGDSPLSDLGIRQAERLRDRLVATGEIPADVLIASTMQRAQQTAQIIAPALGIPVTPDKEVEELRLGIAEGLTVEAYKSTIGTVDFATHPFQPIAPGGEYWGQFLLRAAAALDRIIHQYDGKTIVVVCHGGIIDASFHYFYHMNTLFSPPVYLHISNTSITHWKKTSTDGWAPGWRLVKHNDDFHLWDLNSDYRIQWSSIAR